jgi:enterochelin esterase family protein
VNFLLLPLLAILSTGAVTPKGHVEALTIADKTYGRERKVWVYTPAEYSAKAKPYGLVLFLDGESYLEELPGPATLDAFIAEGKIPPVVAVMLDTSQDRLGDLANRVKFADFAAKELMPWIRAKWHVERDPARVAVAGYSAGGLGAAYLGFRHPELFGNVLSQSGAFWRGNEGTSQPAEWLTEQFRKSPRLPVRFYIEIGAGETHAAANGVIFIEANRRLRDVLQAKHYTVRYVEVAGAKHEPGHWRAALPDGLLYVLRPAP